MGRFLTPSKITLLVLAQIYCKGSVPFSGTAHVLHLLLSNVLLDQKSLNETSTRINDESILDFEQALAGQASVVTGRSVWDVLLKDVWMIDCLDGLEWFIGELPQSIAKSRDELLRDRDEGIQGEPSGRIISTSPLGLFIRRCALEWNKMQFQDTTALWMDLMAYRLPSKSSYTRKNPGPSNAFDSNLTDFDLDDGISHALASITFRTMIMDTDQDRKRLVNYDSDKLMEFQISEMQSIGGRLPEAMRTRLRQMAEMGNSAPKLSHYLRFLDAWRAGNFTSAFDSLHRYFDYTMHSRDRMYYQYALLNLAILHSDFGGYQEAISAMQEAIATARENKDVVCLNYCMSWLYHFGRAFPAQMQAVRETGLLGNELDGLSFLKSRAKEAQMWTLLSTTLISEAKITLQHGGSLALCFENIVRASHINFLKDIPNSTGPSLIVKSAIFSRTGQAHQALSCTERFLLCQAKEAPQEDVLKSTVRQAALLAQMGRMEDSHTALSSVSPSILGVLKYNTYYRTSTLMLRAKSLMDRGQLRFAEPIVRQLVSQQPHPEIDTSTQVSFLEIDLYMRQKKYGPALEKVSKLSNTIQLENDDVVNKAKLLILKATILARTSKPHQGTSLVIRAIDLCYNAKLLPMLWQASLALCYILLESCEFNAALEILRSMLPQVLQCLDCDLAGKCYMLLADTYVGLAGLAGSENELGRTSRRQKQEILMGQAFEMLENAGQQFRWIEELDGQLEGLAKMAQIHVWRDDKQLAEQVGEKYLALKKSYEIE